MASKYIQALREKNKARIEKATDADELAQLQEEQKEIDALEAQERKLLTAYKTALAGGPSKGNEEEEDEGGGDDGSDETGGEGKKALSFDEAIAKIKKKRKEE